MVKIVSFLKIGLPVLTATAIFILDCFSELGVATGINYILVILLAAWYKKSRNIILFATVSTLLIFLGAYFSPPGGELWVAILNRFYSVFSVWAVAIAFLYNLKSKQTIESQIEAFESLTFELKEQLKTLNSSAIVSITDKKGDIISVSSLFSSVSGYAENELIGQNHRMIKSNFHPDMFFEEMWTTLQKGHIWRGDICNMNKDGQHYWVATTISPFFNNADEIEKYISVSFDITKQKQQELKLINQAKFLEKNNEKLARVNKDLEMFSYSVSHDLKAPLRALQGFSKNIADKYRDKLDETGIRWLGFIESNSKKMDDLINDILSFSRMSNTELKSKTLNMTTLVKEVFEAESSHYSIPIEFNLDHLPRACGDPTMISVLWQNLIGNSLKYSSKKEKIIIQVSGTEEKDCNRYFIKDNGAGFDMRFYDKLFGIFQRLHTDDEYSGSGVGLANVKRIIEKHGGTIQAQAKVGQGATFEFTLPRAEV